MQRVDRLDRRAARVAAGLAAQPLVAAVGARDQQPAVRLGRAGDVLAVALRAGDQSHESSVRSVGPCTSTGRPAEPRIGGRRPGRRAHVGTRRRRSAGVQLPTPGGRRRSRTTSGRRDVDHGSGAARDAARPADRDRGGDGHPRPRRPGVHCMKFRRGRIGNGLAVLAGARPDVLAAAPGARAKFVALGGVLLSTGGLALVSMAFAVHMALGVWWPFALLVGLGWGLVVVNLDRMLLVGMAHDSSLKRNLVLAVPRVGLALVLGVVIATPLTLQIFAKEIDTEIVTMQAEAGRRLPGLAGGRRAVRAPAGAGGADRHVRGDRRQRGSGRRRSRGGARRGDGSPGRARRRGRRLARARGQGAVRARRLLRHRRRRHGARRTWRPAPPPTRRRRSWRRRARRWTTPSLRRRPPRGAARPWPPRRWTPTGPSWPG